MIISFFFFVIWIVIDGIAQCACRPITHLRPYTPVTRLIWLYLCRQWITSEVWFVDGFYGWELTHTRCFAFCYCKCIPHQQCFSFSTLSNPFIYSLIYKYIHQIQTSHAIATAVRSSLPPTNTYIYTKYTSRIWVFSMICIFQFANFFFLI